MKFKEFVDTGKLAKFRSIKLGLTDQDTKNDELVRECIDEFELDDLMELKKILNENLKDNYRGKLKFDFCLDDININNIIAERIKDRFRKYMFEANDKIAKSKTEVERKIRGNE
jgi:hypothetical protein